MDAILDFSQELDVGLMDRTATTFFSGTGQEQQLAQQVLTRFQEHPDAWQRVPRILESSSNSQAKYIALQVLEKLVGTRWKVLPQDQRFGIRNFIVGIIMSISADEVALRKQKTYLNKLNMVLVQILKQEWPHNWPMFISELVAASKSNLSVCENNMVILKLLSEEVFDYSAEQMTQNKTKVLKAQMTSEFTEIYQLCYEILEKAQKVSLIRSTLDTLLRFLNWIPLGYIFETGLIEMLISRFLEVPEFRNTTLKCLSEIVVLVIGPEYDSKLISLFTLTMAAINRIIPPDTDISQAYEESSDSDQQLVQGLAIFISNFLSYHLHIVETAERAELLLNAHHYMIHISRVEEREIFKICLEYWIKLVAGLYNEIQALPIGESGLLMALSMGGSSISSVLGGVALRKDVYTGILHELRLIVIEHMSKPEEVLIVENDEGEIVRELMRETDTIVLYKSMRECLIYLTHLDVMDIENILTQKLSKQVDGSEWSWNNLNRLCWAIGSLSGSMSDDTEKRFLVAVIRDLLGLCEMKRGKNNKAVVASNIMYIVGQYPRFLKVHWKFLKTVVNKLFEFMHETHEGVQDMACDTFIKIAQKCRRHFIILQPSETVPFIDEILQTLPHITEELSPLQVHTVYEAIGYMITSQVNRHMQEALILRLMEAPNGAWDSLMQQAAQNVDVLNSSENVKILANVLKTNVATCTSIGAPFYSQFGKIFLDMLGLYRAASTIVSDTVAKDGSIATSTPRVRQLRTIKKEVLKLVDTYIRVADDLNDVSQNLIPPLLDAILTDYARNVPSARDAEVLNLMTTITGNLGDIMNAQISPILDTIFDPTLAMISNDFTEFPEHRLGLYKFLYAVNSRCHAALLQLPRGQFRTFMDCIVWAIKHPTRDIADIGLTIAIQTFSRFAAMSADMANPFFYSYYLPLLQDLLFVLTDADHKSGFKLQCALLQNLFQLVNSGVIQVSLAESMRADPTISNPMFLKQFCSNLLKAAFAHISPAQVDSFITVLSNNCNESTRFKLTVRDFLIALKEFAGDNADLFLEEKEMEAEQRAQKERENAMRIPGMLKPSLLEDSDS